MAQSLNNDRDGQSPAARAMNEAIELAISGRSPYPERATFIDADSPYVGSEIRRAVEQGSEIVLVAADGSTCTLHGQMPEAA